jgi:magnesium-transporting ATPase (P-type)
MSFKEKEEAKQQDYDVEEATDAVPSQQLPDTFLPYSPKVLSDVTGMNHGQSASGTGRATPRIPRANRRSVSDMVLRMNLPPKATTRRRREKSSSDVLTKFGHVPQLGDADLRMAEEIEASGTYTERRATGISEDDYIKRIDEKDSYEPPEEFEFNEIGLSSEEATKRLHKYGRNELPEKIHPKWLLFLQQFWAPMPIMLWIAIIIELGIGNFIDMAILLLIQFANASISFYESNKAGNAIAALKSSLKPTATCMRDGTWSVIDAALLVPGDTVLLASGSAIPADCRVNHSEIEVDQAALTGESLPVTFYKGDSCKMGSTVVRGEVKGTGRI